MSDVLRATLKQARLGLLIFFACLMVCILIRPHAFVINQRISFYGTLLKTIIPYTIGLTAAIWTFYRIAIALTPLKKLKRVRRLLLIVTICITGILITPDSFGPIMDHFHVMFGALLFISEIMASVLVSIRLESVVSWVFTGLLVVAGVYCLASLENWFGIESWGEVAFQFIFASVMLHALRDLIRIVSLDTFHDNQYLS